MIFDFWKTKDQKIASQSRSKSKRLISKGVLDDLERSHKYKPIIKMSLLLPFLDDEFQVIEGAESPDTKMKLEWIVWMDTWVSEPLWNKNYSVTKKLQMIEESLHELPDEFLNFYGEVTFFYRARQDTWDIESITRLEGDVHTDYQEIITQDCIFWINSDINSLTGEMRWKRGIPHRHNELHNISHFTLID